MLTSSSTARRKGRSLRGFLARASLYRAELGEPEAFAAAEMIASEVDNPALHGLVDEGRAWRPVST